MRTLMPTSKPTNMTTPKKSEKMRLSFSKARQSKKDKAVPDVDSRSIEELANNRKTRSELIAYARKTYFQFPVHATIAETRTGPRNEAIDFVNWPSEMELETFS